jgi:hypothetical protein
VPSGSSISIIAGADDGMLELADLIAIRQIGVEIILPVEAADQVDMRLQPQPGAHRLRHAFRLITGSMPGNAASTKLTCAFGAPP